MEVAIKRTNSSQNSKRLPAKTDAEWEAELEGELNEYEMVGGEEGEELNED